jgi:hypothetical protein
VRPNEAALIAALRERYPAPQYAFIPQVREATGFGYYRTADALAMGLWPSRGLHLNGFEVKCDRRDWLRELQAPEKAEPIASRCDMWWVVAADATVVRLEELPRPWGLLVPDAKGKLKATRMAAVLKPKALDRAFLAALLRRAQRVVTPDAILQAEYQRGLDAGREDGKKDAGYRADRALQELEGLRKAVAEFEEHSGVRLATWDAGNIGDAVQVVLAGEGQVRKRAKHLLAGLEDVAATLREVLE